MSDIFSAGLAGPPLHAGLFRSAMGAHPMRTRLWVKRWMLSPGYSRESGKMDVEGAQAGTHEKAPDLKRFWAILQPMNEHTIQRLGVSGVVEVGSVLIITMADELPLQPGDIVAPLGADGTGRGVQSYPKQLTIVRGEHKEPGSGSVSSSGTAVTGSGTAFTTFFYPGAIINSLGINLVVESVQDDTHLTLVSAPPVSWQSVSYSRSMDRLPNVPAVSIDWIQRPSGSTIPGASSSYVSTPEAYRIGATGDRVEWLSLTSSPAPGERYSLSYRYLPTYRVSSSQPLRGTPMLPADLALSQLPTEQSPLPLAPMPQAVIATRVDGPNPG